MKSLYDFIFWFLNTNLMSCTLIYISNGDISTKKSKKNAKKDKIFSNKLRFFYFKSLFHPFFAISRPHIPLGIYFHHPKISNQFFISVFFIGIIYNKRWHGKFSIRVVRWNDMLILEIISSMVPCDIAIRTWQRNKYLLLPLNISSLMVIRQFFICGYEMISRNKSQTTTYEK